jgi:ferredoxin
VRSEGGKISGSPETGIGALPLRVANLVKCGFSELHCTWRIVLAQSPRRRYFRLELNGLRKPEQGPMATDTPIEVELRRSGLTFMVPPEKSILQVLIEEGIDPMYDCQRGECGICQVAVTRRRARSSRSYPQR